MWGDAVAATVVKSSSFSSSKISTPVGRKPRRAHDVSNTVGEIEPGLSRAVGMALPTACLNTSAGFGTIFNGYRPHGTAQIRRGITIGRGQPSARRDFALPVSRGNEILEDEDDDEGRGRLNATRPVFRTPERHPRRVRRGRSPSRSRKSSPGNA